VSWYRRYKYLPILAWDECVEETGALIVASEMVVYIPVIWSPDRVLRDLRKDPSSIACRSITITLSLGIQLLTTIVDNVLTVARRALLLWLLTILTVMASVGTTVASDTLPSIAAAKEAVDASCWVIPSNTLRKRKRKGVCEEGDIYGTRDVWERERERERERDLDR
jgi:hypothetical protein